MKILHINFSSDNTSYKVHLILEGENNPIFITHSSENCDFIYGNDNKYELIKSNSWFTLDRCIITLNKNKMP